MSMERSSRFRPGAVLCTAFTGTLIERDGELAELIATPEALVRWLRERELDVSACTAAQLGRAHALREAIHTAAVATAGREPVPPESLAIINDASREGGAHSILSGDGTRRWQLHEDTALQDALGVIAADAVSVLSGERGGRLARCASPTCRAVFLDTSRGGTRRWCDMGTCGNREKKARFRAQHASTAD